MRVVVNQLPATGRRTGIGHYTLQLLRCLRSVPGGARVEAFPPPWLRGVPEFLHRCRARAEPIESPTPASATAPLAGLRSGTLRLLRQVNRSLWGQCLRALCEQEGYDLYHETNFIPFRADVPTVTTVHDLSVLRHPEWHPADRVAFFTRHFQKGVERSAHFLAISEFGKQEIVRFLGVAPARVTVTYMGVRPGLGPLPPGEVAATLERLGLPPRYLLCLGTVEPRKNVLRLLRAYCALPEALRGQWPLLLVGGWGWNTADVAAYYHDEARHRGVRHLGYLPDADVPAVYNGARALVYPSLYEGFGLPPVEMLACGGAVLASTAGAVAETVGGCAHLVEPEDDDGWRDALERVITEDDWWRSLRRGAVEHARPYSWERCAADTVRGYRHALGRPVALPLPEPRRRAG